MSGLKLKRVAVLFVLIVFSPAFASEGPIRTADETAAHAVYRHAVEYMHRGAKHHFLKTAKRGAYVNYIKFEGAIGTSDRPILFMPGRGETAAQWAETLHDLRKLHFYGSAYLLDHRGQGESQRLTHLQERNVGHVENFRDYVDDLITMVELIRHENHGRPPFIIAHSLGAAILTLALIERPDLTDKAALITPMFDINLGRAEKIVGERVVGAVIKLISLVHPQYTFGDPAATASPYNPLEVKTDDPVRAMARWEILKKYNAYLPLKTARWVSEALDATRAVLKNADKVRAKVLIYGAEKDHIVEQKRMEEISCKMPDCELRILPEAYHALHEGTNPNRINMVMGIGSFFRERELSAEECEHMLSHSWIQPTSRSL